jgi:hypothetical protein
MRRRRLLLVIAVALGLIVLAALAAAVAQVTAPPTVPGAVAGGEPAINTLLMLQDAGAVKYVAAGTDSGLKVYEIRRTGLKYRVTDVTEAPPLGPAR